MYFLYGPITKKIFTSRKDLNNLTSNLKFIFEGDRKSINFLDLRIVINTSIIIGHHIRNILNGQLFIDKLYGQVVYVHLKKIL